MPETIDFDPDRREALSTLLQYAENEALQLKESELAEKIRTAYLSMSPDTLVPRSDICVGEGKNLRR